MKNRNYSQNNLNERKISNVYIMADPTTVTKISEACNDNIIPEQFTKQSFSVYVLKLDGGKFYVGKTKRDIQVRVQEHSNQIGSEWTKIYPPLEIIETIEDADDFDEDKYVKKYMKKYGIENVRGGAYSKVKLSEQQITSLTQEIRSSNDCCYNCGLKGHYVKDCNSKEATTASRITPITNQKSNVVISTINCCVKCGRDNHNIKNCFAKFDIYGNNLYYCGDLCHRCGRNNHTINNCFAKFDVFGNKLFQSLDNNDDRVYNLSNNNVNNNVRNDETALNKLVSLCKKVIHVGGVWIMK